MVTSGSVKAGPQDIYLLLSTRVYQVTMAGLEHLTWLLKVVITSVHTLVYKSLGYSCIFTSFG